MARLFSKKQTKEKFGFVGNRQHIRTVGEMLTVNKEEADLAFKRYKKEIIDDLLLGNGFYKYKSNAYVRLNNIGLLEYIDLQKERYGSKTFCVNFAVMPLYCESKCIINSLGHRLGTYISGKDVWWDYASDIIAEVSFCNVSTAIEEYILPWFEEVATEDGYRSKLVSLYNKKLAEEWLNAMENVTEKERFIQQSIAELRLPNKIRSITGE